MERDIKAIILMLSSQAMINLGIIPDPISKNSEENFEKAGIFVELLRVLKEKTEGNLTESEEIYFKEVYENLLKVYNDKKGN